MDPILYYKVYKKGMDKQVIPKYIKYFKLCHLPYIIKDYVRRAKFKTEN